jgi:hypothetical protein
MFEASNVNQQILGRVGPLSGSFTLFSRVGVSIETIARAAQAVGKRVTFQLFDAESRGLKWPKGGLKPARGISVKPAKARRRDIA